MKILPVLVGNCSIDGDSRWELLLHFLLLDVLVELHLNDNDQRDQQLFNSRAESWGDLKLARIYLPAATIAVSAIGFGSHSPYSDWATSPWRSSMLSRGSEGGGHSRVPKGSPLVTVEFEGEASTHSSMEAVNCCGLGNSTEYSPVTTDFSLSSENLVPPCQGGDLVRI